VTPVTSFDATIFALSSGRLPSGVAVIRMSGQRTAAILDAVCGSVPPPRRAVFRRLLGADGDVIDESLVVWMPGPGSFTGEDCAEFQCHGGTASVAAVLMRLSRFDGCRMAEAGEFSRRAFLNGRMDLTEIESLGDLIDAETETQRRVALAGLQGREKRLYDDWRLSLIRVRAMLEADIDFADEQDVPGSVADVAGVESARLLGEIDAHLGTARAGEIAREGFRVVLAGSPNAGKSTLLNVLAGREAAIVSDIPGTTRDVLPVALNLGGCKVVVEDTAGLRNTDDAIELIGVERALGAIGAADLVLWLCAPGDNGAMPVGRRVWRVRTKADMRKVSHGDVSVAPRGSTGVDFDIGISCKTGEGLELLEDALAGAARLAVSPTHEGPAVMRARHRALLIEARSALVRFNDARLRGVEFAAEELRMASQALGRITGSVDVEDVLDSVFSSFCIGK
jgi:tRNA modification GTPase